MLKREVYRLRDCRERMNIMPLGSAALAGTTFPIDRAFTAGLLGFRAPSANSLDAVSDRDFAIEFLSAASLVMMHLSRMSEELILWSSAQFGFIDISDTYCTGSSIMPQKKNPDVAELTRGKSGRVIGNLVALLMIMKGQPLAYNRDNQEDKEPLFDTLDTVTAAVRVFAGMMPQVTVRRDVMYEAARRGFSTATDLADYLVRKAVPFRDAHEIVGTAVKAAEQKGCDLADMSLEELKGFSNVIEEDVFDVLTLEGSVAARNHVGGTAPEQVRKAIQDCRESLATQ
jgi:argininosuccinate lyase